MIPLKVQCNCGQKYAFDITPADQRIPHAVACPTCGEDGTELANNLLAAKLAEIAAAPPIRISGSPAPMPVPPIIPVVAAADSSAAASKGNRNWFGRFRRA